MTNGPSHDPVHSNQEQKPDVLHPCLTPVLMSNHTPISPWSSTAYLKSSYNDLFWDSVFLHDCPHAFSVDRVKSLFKNYEVQRECCLKCLPLVYVLNDVPYTCSVVSLPFLYPACSFLNLSSTPLLVLSIIILHSIFSTTGSTGMPLQFLKCLVFHSGSSHTAIFSSSVDILSLMKTLYGCFQ